MPRNIGSSANSAISTPTTAGDAPRDSASSDTETRVPDNTMWLHMPSAISAASVRRRRPRRATSRREAGDPPLRAVFARRRCGREAAKAGPARTRTGPGRCDSRPNARGRGIGVVAMLGVELGEARLEPGAALDRRGLRRCGGADAATRAAGSRNRRPRRRRRRARPRLRCAPGARAPPRRRASAACGFAASAEPLRASRVGEEHEAALVERLQQHDARRRPAVRRRPWPASSRSLPEARPRAPRRTSARTVRTDRARPRARRATHGGTRCAGRRDWASDRRTGRRSTLAHLVLDARVTRASEHARDAIALAPGSSASSPSRPCRCSAPTATNTRPRASGRCRRCAITMLRSVIRCFSSARRCIASSASRRPGSSDSCRSLARSPASQARVVASSSARRCILRVQRPAHQRELARERNRVERGHLLVGKLEPENGKPARSRFGLQHAVERRRSAVARLRQHQQHRPWLRSLERAPDPGPRRRARPGSARTSPHPRGR